MGLMFPKPEPRPPKPRKPLRRKKWMAAKRVAPRRSGRGEREPGYLARVRALGYCCARLLTAAGMNLCHPTIEADHAGERPLGRKAPDDTAIPMCRRHHRERTDYHGLFWGWDAERMRRWCDLRIAETRTALEWREKEAA